MESISLCISRGDWSPTLKGDTPLYTYVNVYTYLLKTKVKQIDVTILLVQNCLNTFGDSDKDERIN
jgi:hypothetical protein